MDRTRTHLAARILSWALSPLSLGCGDAPGKTTAGSTSESSSDGASSGAASSAGSTGGVPTTGDAPSAPTVLEILTSKPAITESDPVTFTAVVTDPDGLDTIVGGKLTSEDGATFYGAFTLIGGGSYQLASSWATLHEIVPIEFVGGPSKRVFRVDFIDLDGNHGEGTVELQLTCDLGSACAGVCVDVKTDNTHCGMCDSPCGDSGGFVMPQTCQSGTCPS